MSALLHIRVPVGLTMVDADPFFAERAVDEVDRAG